MTSYESDRLWKRIEEFEFGLPNASLTFADRLARENGWSRSYTDRVVEEYRRFCYLAMTAGHPVTPSEEVDQAWHLHLLYSENYWRDFCGDTLGRDLHHGPTRGGWSEGWKYADWYRDTLGSYARIFGTMPPPAIWPDGETRFRDAARYRRVNTARHWVIDKPSGAVVRRCAAFVVPLALGACAASAGGPGFGIGVLFSVFAAFVIVGLVADRQRISRAAPGRKRRSKNDNGGGHYAGCGVGCGSPGKRHADRRGDDHHTGDADGGDAGCGSAGCGGGGCGSD